MRAKKFAAARVKFEQAIHDNPDFAEAHNNLGFTLRQQGPQNYACGLATRAVTVDFNKSYSQNSTNADPCRESVVRANPESPIGLGFSPDVNRHSSNP
jgi:Tfp pilus assembly protein PilF